MRTGIFIAAVLALSGTSVFGAAQLKSGSKTSCKVTATDPVQKAMQMAADPFGVYEFQFSMTYDPSKVNVESVEAMNDYVLGVRNSDGPVPTFFDDPVRGIISVRGYWPGSVDTVPLRDVDVFKVLYVLDDEDATGAPIPTDSIVPYESVGEGWLEASERRLWQPDAIRGVEFGDDGNFVGFIDTPFNKIERSGVAFASIPEPAGLGLLALAALPLARRRR